MIGQIENRKMIDKWCISKNVPQFLIITGKKGSGKKTLAHYLAGRMAKTYTPIGIKVDDIRDMIATAQRTAGLYVIEDADTMSINAKNAMLKIVEEPPQNTYFVLTVSDSSTLLDTIKGRATTITMESYTTRELEEYRGGLSQRTYMTARNPHEVDLLAGYGNDFFEYVEMVAENIRYVPSANAFKSGNKLAIKTDEGYDLDLFFIAFITYCMNKSCSTDNTQPWLQMILTTPVNQLARLGVNKQQVFDMWCLEIRQL